MKHHPVWYCKELNDLICEDAMGLAIVKASLTKSGIQFYRYKLVGWL